MNFHSYKAIAVNTSHIKRSSFDWLTHHHIENALDMCTFRETGCFLKLHEELSENVVDDMPKDLMNVIVLCWNNGAHLIEFDNNAPLVDQLPTWDWET